MQSSSRALAHANKPPRSHARSRSQAAQVRPDPGSMEEPLADLEFEFLPEAFRFDMAGGRKAEEVVGGFDKVRISIASSDEEGEGEAEALPRRSFYGASHPPEPVEDMVDSVFVPVDRGRGDTKKAAAAAAAVKPVIVWDASPPVSGAASPHGRSSTGGDSSSGAVACTVTSMAPSGTATSRSAKTSVSSSSAASSSAASSDWSSHGTSGAGAGEGGKKPHKGGDPRWAAVVAARARLDGAPLGMSHFRLLRRLGCGDIGTVYLSELANNNNNNNNGGCGSPPSPWFAMKVMDKAALAQRRKEARAHTEREILQLLDHPFLPTLYASFETDRFACLVMEFCPGGDLHALRQRQPRKRFPEHAARFYAAEVLLALEYLHMLGVVYRDLKPENVLVRDDGHVMLSDFDLSLRCATASPTLLRPSPPNPGAASAAACVQPTCFMPKIFGKKKKSAAGTTAARSPKSGEKQHGGAGMPELVVEPTAARSMSFVGTHEYLAPEIIKGEGHGSAVDWWTLGVFLHELMYGRTPFKGQTNRATLFNVVGQQLRFPEDESPATATSEAARDLIRGLLAKEPQGRLGVKRGAAEIKQHPFFQGVNWALIRCSTPPGVPRAPVELVVVAPAVPPAPRPVKPAPVPVNRVEMNYGGSKRIADDHVESGGKFLDFEFF